MRNSKLITVLGWLIFNGLTMLGQANLNKPAVLKMNKTGGIQSYFDTRTRLSTDIIPAGVAGEGTIEFWAMAGGANANTPFQTWKMTNLLTGQDLFAFEVQRDLLKIKKGSTSVDVSLPSNDLILNDQWNHFALTFTTASQMNVYRNGILLRTVDGITIPGNLYFTKTPTDQLLLAEYRVWSRLRTLSQLQDFRFRSLYNDTTQSLTALKDTGLVIAYTNDKFTTGEINKVSNLQHVFWDNVVGAESAYNHKARITSEVAVNSSNVILAEIVSEGDHPIFTLNKIIVYAADGGGVDQDFTNDTKGIALKWYHIKNASSYTIRRRAISGGETPSLVHTVTAATVGSLNVSEGIEYFDVNIVPGVIYEYTITALNTSNSSISTGKDTGFVFHNGEAEGKVITSLQTAVPNVKVEANLESNGVTLAHSGKSLLFNLNASPVIIEDVQEVKGKIGNATLEFWYKTPTTGSASNSVFQLGPAEIRITNTTAGIYVGNTSYLVANKPNDNLWHHYAFVLQPNGAQLYVDGGTLPVGVQTTITPTASNSTPFNSALLNAVTSFSLNSQVGNPYLLDEFRVWKIARTAAEIYNYKNVVLGNAKDPNLMIYYRFDLNSSNEIYSQSVGTETRLNGKSLVFTTTNGVVSSAPFALVESNDIPPVKFASFTDVNGNYVFNSLPGNNGGGTLGYRFIPALPNHQFSPENRFKNIPVSLTFTDSQKTIEQFVDTSTFTVTGEVVYKVADPSGPGGFFKYPVLSGTLIMLDGNTINKPDGTQVTTLNNGTYQLSAPLGLHTFSIGKEVPVSSDANSQQNANADLKSLKFTGSSYAQTKEMIASNANQQFTWSTFYKPKIVTPNENLPSIQTLLQWGDLVVNLQANNRIHLFLKGTQLLQRPVQTISGYNFLAISFNKVTNQLVLMVDDDVVTVSIPAGTYSFNDKLVLGATKNLTEFSKANMDVVEYRDVAYSIESLRKIKNGDFIAEDENYLKLSYTAEQDINTTRVVNMVVNGASNENNYLQLFTGTVVDATASSNLRRRKEFKYVASNASYNPTPNTNLYTLNLTDPISSLNFENLTRHHFIGNIVVPCDNQVGTWTGTIRRTDLVEPQFSKTISASNFNSDSKVFVVKDLLPGVYEVSLTNTASGQTINSFSVDLRNGNIVKDIFFSKPLEHEVTFYKYNALTKTVGDKILPLCDTKYVFNASESIIAFVKAFETYGDTKCPVKDIKVTFSGDLISGSSGITDLKGSTNAEGLTFINFLVNEQPNFIGDLQRSMHFALQRGEGSTVESYSSTTSAYIEGSRSGNNDFTLTNPNVGFVLHDPPGDGSSATLEQGASYTQEYSFEEGTDIKTVFSGNFGAFVRAQTHTLTITAPGGIGVGAGAIISGVGVTLTVDVENESNVSYRKTGGNAITTAIKSSISTPTFATYVGQDADTYIGTSDVLKFSDGQTLSVDRATCVASIKNSRTMEVMEKVPFVFTQQQLKDVTIPNLQRLLIIEIDKLNPPSQAELSLRNSLKLDETIKRILTDNLKSDPKIVKYVFQIESWQNIIKRNSDKLKREQFMSQGKSLSETTNTATRDRAVTTLSGLDQGLSFSGGINATYTFERATTNASGNQVNGGNVTSVTLNKVFEGFGKLAQLKSSVSISGLKNNTNNETNATNRVDSFTFYDVTDGDQFNVSMRRDPDYDTVMFLTNGGRSMCPFESGTVPREGVELVADKTVGYGSGEESVLYTLKLRNTQLAPDNTRKIYIVGLDGATNPDGAQIFLNESPIFEPGTVSPIQFNLDGSSPTGVVPEVTAQLRIKRGLDAPETITYKDITMRIYSLCEFINDGYRSYRVDEFNEVGVKPFSELKFTAHFGGKCVTGIEQEAPIANWTVNNTSNNIVPFRFKIPGITDLLGAAPAAGQQETSKFQVILEYATQGTNTPVELVTLNAAQLRANLNSQTGVITYNADVSGLADGTYSFRITPVCDPTSSNPNSRNDSTAFVSGTINRNPAVVVSTNPSDNGILTQGTISATFDKAINPATVNINSVSLRGELAGKSTDLISAEFTQGTGELTIPHQPVFNLDNAYTIEMWLNPSRMPNNGVNVPIIQKGNNYTISLTPSGAILVNDLVNSNTPLQPFAWTHVAVVFDGVNSIGIYFNGVQVASGLSNGFLSNIEPIVISKANQGQSYIGKFDEIRIWNSARTPIQIISTYQRKLLGNETNLIAYFTLDNDALKGIDGAPDEAIRDYTGNARGTTAIGLSFVTGDANAAPLDISTTVKDFQFTSTVSNNNTTVNITPAFTSADIEGAKLTAMFNEDQLRDQSGNKLKGYNWSFVVNRNAIKWSVNNVTKVQLQGNELVIDDVDLVNTNGGVPVRYRFVNLPYWLKVRHKLGATVTPIAEGTNRIVQAQQIESNLEFIVAPFLNNGRHTTVVSAIVENANTGIPLGIESFVLEINTQCNVPNYSIGFNNGNFTSSQNVVGQLFVNGVQSLDTNDQVAVYIDGQYRGGGNVALDGTLRFGIFGETIDNNKELIFKVWKAMTCTEYDGIIENYHFQANGRLGTSVIPVRFTVGKRLSRSIGIQGVNYEVSFNLEDTQNEYKISLNQIKGLSANDEIRDVINTDKVLARANSQGVLVKTAELLENKLDITKAYLVRRTSSTPIFLTFSGLPVSENKNISITGNHVRNSIAYLPNEMQRVNYALRSLTSTVTQVGDIISRRGLLAEYTSDKGWIGSLTHLTPGQGYELSGTSSGVLNYFGIVSSSSSSSSFARGASNLTTANEIKGENEKIDVSYLEKAARIGWKTTVGDYSKFMYFTAVLDDYPFDPTKEFVIAGFINNEVRGVAKPQLIDGKYYYFLGIGSDESNDVTFKLYDGNKFYLLDNKVSFDERINLGRYNAPYVFKYTEKEVVNSNKEYILSQNYPNPLNESTEFIYAVPNDTFVEIHLYNLLGQHIYTFVNQNVKGGQNHYVKWDGYVSNRRLPSGIYNYVMIVDGFKLDKKLIIK
ncbi:MAG: T9SS type A sorting domain-containing protein [Limnohabitans sp.]|nr:T9SS type A sorting domain-containing protein [Limnohabitans sp.]